MNTTINWNDELVLAETLDKLRRGVSIAGGNPPRTADVLQSEAPELSAAAVERLWRAHRQGIDVQALTERFGVARTRVLQILRDRRIAAEMRDEPTGPISDGVISSRCRISGYSG